MASPYLELLKNCPQPACGEPVDAGAAVKTCPHCGAVYQICPGCSATNRTHVEYCRCCREGLSAAAWPLHPGLRAGMRGRASINSLGKISVTRLSTPVVAAPIALGETILIPAQGGGIVLIDEEEGKPLGRINTGQPIEVTPAINAGFLFVAAGHRLSAFDLLEGVSQKTPEEMRTMWTYEAQGGDISCPLLVSDNAVYFVTRGVGGGGSLEAVSQVDGRIFWTKPLSLEAELLPVTLSNDRLILITTKGEALAVHPQDGRVVAKVTLDVKVDAAVTPFAVGDHVLFADKPAGHIFKLMVEEDRLTSVYLYALEARVSCIAANEHYIVLGHSAGVTLLNARGDQLWEDTSGEAVSVAPVLAGDSLCALDDVGNIIFYKAEQQGNSMDKRKFLAGDIATPPIMTRSKIAAVNSEGMLALVECL